MEAIKVVMRYADGAVIKGYSNDFFPNRPSFHVHPVGSNPTDKGIQIEVRQLKGVFFVKDFDGNPSYDEKNHFEEGIAINGRKVEVTFTDGEVMVGTTVGYDRSRPGFFIYPADSASNNLRVYVVASAVKNVRFL